MGNFQEQLEFGKVAESKIARWLLSRGYNILPVYDKIDDEKIGPRLFTPDGSLIAPDILVWRDGETFWIEAKHKTVFTWYRKRKQWETGIDLRHYEHYLELATNHSAWQIWLLFLHESHIPDKKDRLHSACPDRCPVGLFGGELLNLSQNFSHTSDKWGSSGMIYWPEKQLKFIASLQEIQNNSMTKKSLETNVFAVNKPVDNLFDSL